MCTIENKTIKKIKIYFYKEIAQKEINPRLFGVFVCVPICLCACSIYTYL